MPIPSVDSRTVAIPKEEGTPAEYEDAAAVRAEGWPVRAAVADGATESVYAGRWASLLAEGLVGSAVTPEALLDALPGWQAQWRVGVEKQAEVPWYVEAKAREGAFAALLGLEVRKNSQWRAVSVGDCGLFHFRNGEQMEAWPTADPDVFTNRPALLPSRPSSDPPEPEATTGTWTPGDTFVLATDAVAAWLLGTDPTQVLNASEETIRATMREAQTDGTLRPDDATLIVLTMAEPAPDRPADTAP